MHHSTALYTARSGQAAGSVHFANAAMATDGELHLQEPVLVHRVG